MLEILSTILDILPIRDLIQCARVSRKTREMVYDDTRWVKRLQLMGCWDELGARKRAESNALGRSDVSLTLQSEEARSAATGVNESVDVACGSEKPRKLDPTIFDAKTEEERQKRPGSGLDTRVDNVYDGFDAVTLAPGRSKVVHKPQDASYALNVFVRVASVRGHARQEYSKIHEAIAPLYNDAISCEQHVEAKVFRIYRDPNQQAQMLANLRKFSESDISQGWQSRCERLISLIEAFENAVLREFEQGLEARDYEGKLRKYAKVLVCLNGGQKGIELFISRSPVISQKILFGHPIACLNDGGPNGLSLEPSHKFFTSLSLAFNELVSVIDQVFPTSSDIVVFLLQRTGEEVISEYLATLFHETYRRSVDLYLKAVSSTYEQSLRFAKSLRPGRDSGNSFYEAVDAIIAKVFEPHLDPYLEEEMGFFNRKSDEEVSSWERQLSEQDASMQSMYMSNVTRQADKRDFLTSFKKVVMMPVNVLPNFPISSSFSGKQAAAKVFVDNETVETSPTSTSQPSTRPSTPSGIEGAFSGNKRISMPRLEPPTSELAAKAAIMNSRLEGIRTLFSIEVALSLVHSAKESIDRTAVFIKAGDRHEADVRKQCQSIFIILLQTLGTRHIQTGFDKALKHLSNYKPQEAHDHGRPDVIPLVTFLELVNVGDLIQQMLDVFYEQELVAAGLVDRNDFIDPAAKEKKHFEQVLDERVAAGLNKGIEVLMMQVEFICATTQNPEDFNPGVSNDAHLRAVDIDPSNTAKQIVDVLSSHTKMLIGSAEKNMLDVFNQEVGLRLFTSLCKHLKRQRISINGSVKLIRYVS